MGGAHKGSSEPVVIILMQRGGDGWAPSGVVRLGVREHRIQTIADYHHCPWILGAATSVAVAESPGG